MKLRLPLNTLLTSLVKSEKLINRGIKISCGGGGVLQNSPIKLTTHPSQFILKLRADNTRFVATKSRFGDTSIQYTFSRNLDRAGLEQMPNTTDKAGPGTLQVLGISYGHQV